MTVEYVIADCLEWLPTLPDNSVDLIIADPPYGINYISGWYKNGNPFTPIHNDKTFNRSLNQARMLECYRVLKNNSASFVFAGYQNIDDWIKLSKECGFTYKNLVVWVKNNWTAGDLKGNFANQHELILFLTKGRFILPNCRPSNVINCPREPPSFHPTTKPLDLIINLIEKTTSENATIIDPFLGSGTTLRACLETGRSGIGCEKNIEYEPIIKERIRHANIPLTQFMTSDGVKS